MALYFVEYELRKKRDYPRLTEELESLGAVRVLNSYWCLNRESITAEVLRDHLRKFIDSDDALMVTEVTDWASVGTLSNPNEL